MCSCGLPITLHSVHHSVRQMLWENNHNWISKKVVSCPSPISEQSKLLRFRSFIYNTFDRRAKEKRHFSHECSRTEFRVNRTFCSLMNVPSLIEVRLKNTESAPLMLSVVRFSLSIAPSLHVFSILLLFWWREMHPGLVFCWFWTLSSLRRSDSVVIYAEVLCAVLYSIATEEKRDRPMVSEHAGSFIAGRAPSDSASVGAACSDLWKDFWLDYKVVHASRT